MLKVRIRTCGSRNMQGKEVASGGLGRGLVHLVLINDPVGVAGQSQTSEKDKHYAGVFSYLFFKDNICNLIE